MPWTGQLIRTRENPVPNNTAWADVRFTDGTRTFDQTYKVTADQVKNIEQFIDGQVQNIEALYGTIDESQPGEVVEPTPYRAENFQFRMALHNAGKYTAANSFLTNNARPQVVREAWDRANYFYRDGGIARLLTQQGTITEEQMDQIFRDAAGIQP